MPEFLSDYFATSVDDLRSTLKCELHNTPHRDPRRIAALGLILSACPANMPSKRKVIVSHIRALEKLPPSLPPSVPLRLAQGLELVETAPSSLSPLPADVSDSQLDYLASARSEAVAPGTVSCSRDFKLRDFKLRDFKLRDFKLREFKLRDFKLPARSPDRSSFVPATAGSFPPIALPVRELSLGMLEAMPMPVNPARSVALEAMTVAQLGEAFAGLEKAQGQYESLSGICATLAGIVLREVKQKVGHGNFGPWVKHHFVKSWKTACLYMSLAEKFVKFNPRVRFEQLSLSVLDGAQSLEGQTLDFAHPLVSRVAKWTKGRTFYQLRMEELSPGGNNHPKCPHCEGDLKSATQELCPHCGKATGQTEPTPEQIRSELTEQTRQWAQDQLGDSHAAKKLFRLLPNHEAAALSAHYRALAKEIDEWVKTPERQREQLAIEEVLA